MNQLQALRETITLGDAKGMPDLPGSALGLEHLRGMVSAIESGSFPSDKLGRWLGWAQCAVVAADVGVTLDDMKALNVRCVDDAEVSDDPTESPALRGQSSSYWKRQYKAAEKAKMLAISWADQAEERLRKARESAAGELAEAHESLAWVRKLHQPTAAATCTECGRDWPCATIRAVGDSL